jgi:putative flavoprotein involved in K+ transport
VTGSDPFEPREVTMTTQHIETLIIGAGQAGLSTGQQLQSRGRPFLIVDGNDRIGDNWRQQWDTLRLFTPARYDRLPGLPFPAPDGHFPHKDEVAAYLEAYALHFDLPVRMSTRVVRLTARPGGGYVADLGVDEITCDNVVVATGTFGRTPYVPDAAADLRPSIVQLHSSAYRRPTQLRPGPVLVVGASHSGCEIAHELAAGHPVTLCGRDCGQIPASVETRRGRVVLPIVLFVFRHVLTRRTPLGRKERDEFRFHGGPALRIRRPDLAARGVQRLEARVVGTRDGLPMLADGTVVDAANVVWCTGFRQVFDWIDVPVFDEHGWPEEYRGVATGAAGLFFCGLCFQFAASSMTFAGVGRDAEHVARRIAARARTRQHATS